MAFFLIVPSVMIVSVVLVHALAKKLGLQIYYATLVAVAVLSFMADFAATLISPAGGREFLLRLGLMILASSFLLTYANRFLENKQREEEERFTEEVKAAYEAEIKRDVPVEPVLEKFSAEVEDLPPPPRYNEPVINAPEVEEKVSEADTKSEVDEKVSEADTKADEKVSEADADEEVAKLLAETKSEEEINALLESSEPVENPALPEEFPLEEVFEPLPEVKPEEADKPIEPEKEPEENFPLEEVFKPLPEVKPEVPEPKPEPEEPKHTEIFPLQEVFQPLSTLRLDKIEEITQEEKKSEPETQVNAEDESEAEDTFETLDDILDKAYSERAKGHVWQAIELYKTALERYRNDEYAPFVAIDLGNIYKEEALYSKAIKIYEDALNLPAVKRNEEIKKEFAANLEYLRVVRDVLLKYQAMSTPFGKLSKEILQEIDTEFNKIKLHSAQ